MVDAVHTTQPLLEVVMLLVIIVVEMVVAMVVVHGVFWDCRPPKKFKYGKPRLGESTLTKIVLDTPNLA